MWSAMGLQGLPLYSIDHGMMPVCAVFLASVVLVPLADSWHLLSLIEQDICSIQLPLSIVASRQTSA